jgi:hypothetical protein
VVTPVGERPDADQLWRTPNAEAPGVSVEVGIQLGELALDGGEGCVHLRLPSAEQLVKGGHHGLQATRSHIADPCEANSASCAAKASS